MVGGLLKRYWYLLALLVVLILGFLTSSAGRFLNPSSITTTVIVVVIFLIAGMTLPSENIRSGLRHVGLHLYIQIFTFVVFPLYFVVSLRMFSSTIDEHLYAGLIALACLPTTISTCIVFTQSAGGNVVGTMFNASLSNLLGIFLSPLLISLLLSGSRMSLPMEDVLRVLKSLALKMLAPIAAGQLLRLLLKHRIASAKPAVVSRLLILLIIYFTIAKAAANPLFLQTLSTMVLPFLYLAVSHLLLLLLAYGGSRILRFPPENVISVVFTAPQKTMAMGVPLLTTYFAGQPDLLGVAILPLVFYHSWQLIAAGIIRSVAPFASGKGEPAG